MLINSIEMLTLFVLVLSLWTTLWFGQRRTPALLPARLGSATDAVVLLSPTADDQGLRPPGRGRAFRHPGAA